MGFIDDGIDTSPANFIHPSVHMYGDVRLGHACSLWINAAVRSELHYVEIGDRTNLQDHVMVHVGFDHPVIIGKDCSITHHATLHGCTIGDRTLIGIGATIMDGAVIGANSVVAGHTIVPEGMTFPDNSIIAGVPARHVKDKDCSKANVENSNFYVQNAINYANGTYRV